MYYISQSDVIIEWLVYAFLINVDANSHMPIGMLTFCGTVLHPGCCRKSKVCIDIVAVSCDHNFHAMQAPVAAFLSHWESESPPPCRAGTTNALFCLYLNPVLQFRDLVCACLHVFYCLPVWPEKVCVHTTAADHVHTTNKGRP